MYQAGLDLGECLCMAVGRFPANCLTLNWHLNWKWIKSRKSRELLDWLFVPHEPDDIVEGDYRILAIRHRRLVI